MKRWRKQEIERLKVMWPAWPKRDLLAAFPGRSWTAMQAMAERLKLRRAWKFAGRVSPPKTKLMEALRDARVAKQMSAKQLSRMIGRSERYVSQCERGALSCNLASLERWVAALGLELTVVRPVNVGIPVLRASAKPNGHCEPRTARVV